MYLYVHVHNIYIERKIYVYICIHTKTAYSERDRSLFSSLMWAIGVPIFTFVVMQKHEVPQMSREKQVFACLQVGIDVQHACTLP
jgi:hypothetical protein